MKKLITERAKFPRCIRYFHDLIGISMGGCIDNRRRFTSDEIAHAHSYYADPHRGWICLRYKSHIKDRLLLLHEIAHLIANKAWDIPDHGKEWKNILDWLMAIGGGRKKHPHINNY